MNKPNACSAFSLVSYIQISWIYYFALAGLFWSSDFDFKNLAFEELQKYSQAKLVSLASSLAEGVGIKSFKKWGEPGIRAQLLNIRDKKLEMDFVTEGDERSLHILNAVSPAFTCALPFADFACDKIADLSNR